MNLGLDREVSKQSVLDFVNAARKSALTKQQTEVVSGNSLIARIKNIISLVQERLGKYKDNFILIRDIETLSDYIDACVKNGIIAIDTETTGLNPISDQLVGVCIYTEGKKAAYIPINHIGHISEKRLDNQLTEAEVASQLKRCLDIKSIFFNAKFDIRVMKNHLGLNFNPTWDGYLAAMVLKEDEEEANLKYLHNKYCGNADGNYYTFEKMFKGINFALIPPETGYLYAANDAVITYELYMYQKPLLDQGDELCRQNGYEKLSFVYHNIELPLITVVAEMEENGICLDTEFAKQLSIKYNEKLKDIEAQFIEEVSKYSTAIMDYRKSHKNCKLGDPININSPAQLSILLYDILGYACVDKKNPKGTKEEILEKFNTPLTKIILDYRGVAKLLSTYIDKLPNEINPKTERIHASFNQMGASTGRFSCIAAGTKIALPSGDKNIEDVVAGDYVYGYDDSGKLQLQRVVNRWYTGIRKCVRLHWVSKYKGQHHGILDCTPDHYIKTTDGWVQAQNLTPQHHIYFLNRRILESGYVQLCAFGGQGDREHNWINKHYFKTTDPNLVVHHIDRNKANNSPDNLMVLTPKQHVHVHQMQDKHFCGAIGYTRDELIQLCESVQWDISKISHDYYELKKWLRRHKINYIKEYTDAYKTRPTTVRRNGKSFKYKSLPLTQGNLQYALELADFDVDLAASFFGENSKKFIKACDKYQLLDNHNVVKIEFLETPCDVYDIEVESTHSFIANEICVHNSSNPNLQNVPSHNTEIRKMFTASNDTILETSEDTLKFFSNDIVPTLRGDIRAVELIVDDVILGEDGKCSVMYIDIDEKLVKTQIKEEKCM